MRRYTDEEFAIAVAESRSKAEALDRVGLRPTGGNYQQFNRLVAQLGLDTGHMGGAGWRRGEYCPERDLSEYLVKDGPFIKSGALRRRLIKEDIKDGRCEECGINEWTGRPAPLQLDHVNGDRQDNRLENLRVLCANCHCLTPTHSKMKTRKPPKFCVDCGVPIHKQSTRCIKCAPNKAK